MAPARMARAACLSCQDWIDCTDQAVTTAYRAERYPVFDLVVVSELTDPLAVTKIDAQPVRNVGGRFDDRKVG